MSKRIEAAANLEIEAGWLVERDPNGGDWYGGHMLPGSDCTPLVDLTELPGWLLFSDEAIERAAKAAYDEEWGDDTAWVDQEEYIRASYRYEVRVVIAALKGDA